MGNLLAEDLDHVLSHTEGLWEELRGQRIFITGGTGFFGCWLLESFAWANDKLGLGATAVVLTRNLEAFGKKAPHLTAHPAVQFHSGDVRSFEFPAGSFSHIIHAATESSTRLNEENPLLMLDTIVEGTRHTLDFARHCGTPKFLLTSSGAVYGKQPPDLTHIPEDYVGAPDPLDSRSAYGEGKRLAELLCAIYAKQYGIETKIARCFAFVGPYLPLDIRFAIGSFMRNGIQGNSIVVKGDGTPYRSYLYVADLVIWLWTILFRADACRPYNVGSAEDLTIAEVARMVAAVFPRHPEVHINKQLASEIKPERYVPAVERAKYELALSQWIDLASAVRKTVDFDQVVSNS